MKNIVVLLSFVMIGACKEPVTAESKQHYELIYSSTVSVHHSEEILEEALMKYMQTDSDGSTLINAELYQSISDSNSAIINRIDEAVVELKSISSDQDNEDMITRAIAMLDYQRVYHENTVVFVLGCGKDGILDAQERSNMVAWTFSRSTLKVQYNLWKELRGNYSNRLGLSEAEQQAMSDKYGKD